MEDLNGMTSEPAYKAELYEERRRREIVERELNRERNKRAEGTAGVAACDLAGSTTSIAYSFGLTPDLSAMVDDMFEYHSWNAEQTQLGKAVRRALAEAVKVIVDSVPACGDRTTAIRKLREARMDCNSAITHRGKY